MRADECVPYDDKAAKMKRRAANTARGRKVERQEATSLGEQVDVK